MLRMEVPAESSQPPPPGARPVGLEPSRDGAQVAGTAATRGEGVPGAAIQS